jgi:hypothetical protein
LTSIAYAHWGGISFYHARELLSVYPGKQLSTLATAPDDQHVAAWSGKSVQIFSRDGVLRAQMEFARRVTDVAFVDSAELVVASGLIAHIALT